MMFKLNVDRNYRQNQGEVSSCFPEGHEDGIFYFPIRDYTAKEIEGCQWDITSGQFTCRQGASFFYQQGSARLEGVELDDDEDFQNCPADCGECELNSDCLDFGPCTLSGRCENPRMPSAACVFDSKITCINDDGCCPAGCDSGTDNDCAAGLPEEPPAPGEPIGLPRLR